MEDVNVTTDPHTLFHEINGTGSITAAEFQKTMGGKRKDRCRKPHTTSCLSALVACRLRQLLHGSNETWSQILDRVDTDGDKSISWEEFEAALTVAQVISNSIFRA